jgi:23S rRNA pseudouridine2605 synthase
MRAAGTSVRPHPVAAQPTRTDRNDRRPRTGGQGKAGTAVPRLKPAAKPNQAPGGSGLHARADAQKSETQYIGAESFNRLKKAQGGPGRGGRGGSGRSR